MIRPAAPARFAPTGRLGYAGCVANPSELETALGRALSAHPEVAVVYLFGSRARGDARTDSDINLGLVFQRKRPSRQAREQLFDEVAAHVGRATGIERVDVLDLAEQGPIFSHRVLCEGRRVFESDRARRIDFESDTIVRALDFRPTYELATEGKIRALRSWLRKRHDVGRASVEARRTADERR